MKYLLISMILITGCSKNDPMKSDLDLWENGVQSREQGDFRSSISFFNKIIANYPKSSYSDKAQFQIADIYLNEIKDFQFAIAEFTNLINLYPSSELCRKASFMIAYIYANYLDAYSIAIDDYNAFLEKYPDDELVPSVNFELNNLMKYKSTIDSLNNILR